MAEISYERRSELLRTHQLPMLQEPRQFMGTSLADIVLHTMSPKSQQLMGVSKPLSSPPHNLWIDPQAHLDGHVVLTEPGCLECLKAFTHQTIIKYGVDIERKAQLERDAAIADAIRETEEFEQFECTQRINYAVNVERDVQLSERDQERHDLLAMFQEERDQILETHAAELTALTASLDRKSKRELERRIAEEMAIVEQRSLELECRWRVEEVLLTVFIEDAQRRQDEAVGQTKADFMQIFKKLFQTFVAELQEQKDDIYCRHLAEMMHVVCVEKAIAAQKIDAVRIDLTKTIDALRNEVADIKEQPDLCSQPKKCPNLLKLKSIFISMLKQYAEFVEWSLGESHDQGQFLIPIQKHLQSILLEEQHPNCAFDCCVSPRQPEQPSIARSPASEIPSTPGTKRCGNTNADMQFVCSDMPEVTPADPIYVAACEVKKEKSLSTTESECSYQSSSLSCFALESQVYASNKHFNSVCGRFYPTEPKIEAEWKDDEEDRKSVGVDDTLAFISDERIQLEVNDAANNLIEELAYTDEETRPKVLRRCMQQLANLIVDLPYKKGQSHPHSHLMSKLLSAVDSVEMMTQTQRFSTLGPQMSSESGITGQQQMVQPLDTDETDSNTKIIQCDLCEPDKPVSAQSRNKSRVISVGQTEYLRSLQSVPSYMRSKPDRRSTRPTIWDHYQVTTDEQWAALMQQVSEMKDRDNRHVRMAEKETMTISLSRYEARLPWSTTASVAGIECNWEDRRVSRKRARTILRLDRNNDGRQTGMTMKTLLERMEDDVEIAELLRKPIDA